MGTSKMNCRMMEVNLENKHIHKANAIDGIIKQFIFMCRIGLNFLHFSEALSISNCLYNEAMFLG